MRWQQILDRLEKVLDRWPGLRAVVALLLLAVLWGLLLGTVWGLWRVVQAILAL